MTIQITTRDSGYWKLGIYHGVILETEDGYGVGPGTDRPDEVWVRCPKREFGFTLIPAKDFVVID
jgi:hypothetical protein